MYNHILVPVDGSETSLLGLQHAILLAKDQKAVLRLLHVVHDYLLADGRHALVISGELLKDLRERGQTILNDAASLARKPRCRSGDRIRRVTDGTGRWSDCRLCGTVASRPDCARYPWTSGYSSSRHGERRGVRRANDAGASAAGARNEGACEGLVRRNEGKDLFVEGSQRDLLVNCPD